MNYVTDIVLAIGAAQTGRRREPQVVDEKPGYVRQPCYRPAGDDRVRRGLDSAAASLPPDLDRLAVDGPAMPGWDDLIGRLAGAVSEALGRPTAVVPTDRLARPWSEIVAVTRTPELADDPDFARLADGTLADLLVPDPTGTALAVAEQTPSQGSRSGAAGAAGGRPILIVYGPGAALVDADAVWWADRPKRYAEDDVTGGRGRNLFQPDDVPATTKRLFYIDWPLLDRHRDAINDRIDLWLDLRDHDQPTWLTGDALRAACADLARRPFRTLPTFNSTPWGGSWAQRELGFNPDKPNTALGYELIAPESGVLVGDGPELSVEVPFQLIVARHPVMIMGRTVHDRFGTSFPIRFDYLDTVGGGNLSVHTHPQPAFMREVFGWPYTQHESYYLMVGGEQNKVFLGLQGDADVEEFHREASAAHHEGRHFDIERFVQTFPATPHQLFLVPAGTPHGSGAGNVVLEVSATPYLYSLRFFDWLRRGQDGTQRPVHVEHAFRNLDHDRRGDAVASQLIQPPRVIAKGDGWHEELLGALPEMFFEVRRVVVTAGSVAPQPDDERFHVLTVVEGSGCRIETASGLTHDLHYAETIAIPAEVGEYQLRCTGSATVRVVKANVA